MKDLEFESKYLFTLYLLSQLPHPQRFIEWNGS